MRTLFLIVVLSSCCLVTACSEESAIAPSSTEQDGPESAVPGSHEDWCVEHAVPESMCTRCNPSLNPAFQATGDWCAEHGLPESQCRACNPDLHIVRPPPEES